MLKTTFVKSLHRSPIGIISLLLLTIADTLKIWSCSPVGPAEIDFDDTRYPVE